jgi:HTH-type transcriptional regulator / antitoxin MqsA
MTDLKPRQRLPNVCPRCATGDARVAHLSEDVPFKGLTLEVHGLAYTVCNACHHRWTTGGQEADNLTHIREAYAVKRDEVRAADGLLSGEDIQKVLSQLGLSKAEAAGLFGGGPHAFAKYMTGDVLQSKAMDRLLRLTLAFGDQALCVLRKGPEMPLTIYAGLLFHASTSADHMLSLEVISVRPAGTEPRQEVSVMSNTLNQHVQ